MPNPDNNQLMQQLVKTVEHPIRFLSLAGQRVANNALAFAAETDPDFEQLLRVGGEGGGVLLVLDLLQGLTIYHNGTSSFKTSLKSSANLSKGCGVDNAFGHRSPVTFPLTHPTSKHRSMMKGQPSCTSTSTKYK
jgi:hypothetical protein